MGVESIADVLLARTKGPLGAGAAATAAAAGFVEPLLKLAGLGGDTAIAPARGDGLPVAAALAGLVPATAA